MARKHRRLSADPPSDLSRLALGGARLESRRGRDWYVREIPAHRAEKPYRCPGCELEIPVGQAHLVAWSADDLFGDAAAVRGRRHWHSHCWRLP